MHFTKKIKSIIDNNKFQIYVDMDGVIANYDIGKAYDFDKKRPLTTNIKKLEIISNFDNVEMHILSICNFDYQIKEKNGWLDKNANFFKKENRHIISKENNPNFESKELKARFLEKRVGNIILIDDDNQILHYVKKTIPNVVVLQDSEFVD